MVAAALAPIAMPAFAADIRYPLVDAGGKPVEVMLELVKSG